MSRVTDEYNRAKAEFEAQLGMEEIRLIVQIRNDINRIGKGPSGNGFVGWHGTALIQSEERLARWSELLGEAQAEAETKAEWLKSWLEEQFAKEYPTVKREQEMVGKATEGSIENELIVKYADERKERLMWQGLSKRYRALLTAIDRIMLATTHRIKELERQQANSGKTG